MEHSSSGSWVYIFSQFTSEALYFEILAIFSLIALYAAFWILKKRRFGVVDTDVPPGVVKVYLNELIGDAERLRNQLFGLLAREGLTNATGHSSIQHLDPALLQSLIALQSTHQSAQAPVAPPSPSEPSAPLPDGTTPEIQTRFAELETKLKEQAQAAEALFAEKTRIQQELQVAKATTGGGGGPGLNTAELEELKKKIKELEGRLAEYSVIEDDLANLKRLQQENQALKQALESGGGTVAAAIASVAPAASATTEAPTPSTSTPPAEAAAPATATSAIAATEAPAATPAQASSKNEDELLAEFEKMLGT